MFPQQLKKILQLIKKTRDRVVIFDANTPDESYVVMDFDNYSDLAVPGNRSNDRLISPANRSSESGPEKASGGELSTNSDQKVNLTEEDLTDKINREISMWKNGESSLYLAEESKSRPGWKIPPSVKDKAQEIKE